MDPASLKTRTQKQLLGRCSHHQEEVLLMKRDNGKARKHGEAGLQGTWECRPSGAEGPPVPASPDALQGTCSLEVLVVAWLCRQLNRVFLFPTNDLYFFNLIYSIYSGLRENV